MSEAAWPALLGALEKHPKLTRLLFAMFGAVAMLAFAPFGFYWLAPFTLLPFLYASYCCQPRQAARYGFWFGFGLFLAGTYWLYISIHVFGQAPLWVAIVIMLGLVMIMGLYYALTAVGIRRLSIGKSSEADQARSLPRFLLVAPAVWVAVEWLRGWFLSGFPWMSVGYAQIDSPLAAYAPFIGVYGVSFAVMISSCGLFAALIASGRPRLTPRLMYGAVAIAPWLMAAALPANSLPVAGKTLTTTIVQGGVSQDRKWLPEQFWPTLQLYRASLAEHRTSDLIIWPEVALPATIDQIEPYLRELEEELEANDQTLLLGILERDFEQQKIYNSMLILNGGDRQVYRKRHLVPFGEFFPVPSFVRNWMRMMNLPNSDLNAGEDRQPLLVTRGGEKLAIAICYEDAYGAEQLYGLPAAGILINVSNDAWFGDSIAPHQHLEIARMRALEAGRYAVRSTNNGVSAFIDADGSILESGPQFEYLALTREITPLGGLTLYARLGNMPIVVLCLLLIAWALHTRKR